MKLTNTKLLIATMALCTSATASAESEKFRIALKQEVLADGDKRIGVENRSDTVLRCRHVRPNGQTFEVSRLPPGTTFWIGVVDGPPGKWNCQRSGTE